MRSCLLALTASIALSGCTDLQGIGSAAIEKRRMMNDLQARATLAATCDIAIGSYFRALNDQERRFAALICGGAGTLDTVRDQSTAPTAEVSLMRNMESMVEEA